MEDVAAEDTAPAVGDSRTGGVPGVARRLLDHPQAVVALATAAMAGFVLWGLGSRDVWLDEGFTIMHTRLGWGDFWEIVFDREMNAVLHSALTHVLGTSESLFWLRFPSAVSAVALVPVTYLLGRRLFTPAVGAVAAVFVTANGFVVEYGQEGRGYALLILVSAASALLLVRALQEDDTRSWVAWVLVSCLLVYAHFFGALVLVAEVVALGVRWLARSSLTTRWRPVLVGLVVIGVANLPIAWFFVAGGSKGQNDGLPAFTVERFLGVWVRLAGNFGIPLVVLVAIPCVAAVWFLWTSRRRLDEQAWGVLFCTAAVVLPVLLVGLVSLVDTLFVARYFVGVIPFLALLAAFGMTRLRPPWLQLAVAVGIVLLGLGGVLSWHGKGSREDTSTLVALLAEASPDGVQAGDAIVFDPWFARIPVEVQLEDAPEVRDRLAPVYPATPWGEWLPTDDPGELDGGVVEQADVDRLWVVQRTGPEGTTTPLTEELEQALVDGGYEATATHRLDGVQVTRYERG